LTSGQEVAVCGLNLAHGMFLYLLEIQNNFSIFKQLQINKQKANNM
jgi:hypothetical protein